MRYYVASDIHGFYTEFHRALTQAGYFNDTEPHKLILLGDLFDRGREAKKIEVFVLDLLDKDEVILIRGNHEDLFEELVTDDHGTPYKHHMSNGTFDTAMQLTHFDLETAVFEPDAFVAAAKQTPFFLRILPKMHPYYETAQHIFVHGWIPCIREKTGYSYRADWRNATDMEWREARWYNGIDAAINSQDEKTIVCGHWHASYGHAKYLNRGNEFGPNACFEPYYNTGIIAIDGCTAYSGIVNVVVIEDSEIEGQGQ